MKFYKPLFSIIAIIVQLILSLKEYYKYKEWEEANLQLDFVICFNITYDTLLFFIFIIGIYEMLTKPSWLKTTIRILLVCIILGTEFSEFVPINQFYFGVYNTAWFSAVVAIILILVRIGKYGIKKIYKARRQHDTCDHSS